MKSRLLNYLVLSSLLVGMVGCDFSAEALLGKRNHPQDDSSYGSNWENGYRSGGSCQRTVMAVDKSCFFEELDEIVAETKKLDQFETRRLLFGQNIPFEMESAEGLRVVTKVTRDKRKVEVASIRYEKIAGAAIGRDLRCFTSVPDPYSSGYHVSECILVVPRNDKARYRLVSFTLKAGDCKNSYTVSTTGDCDSHEVDIGGGTAPVLESDGF